MQTQKGSVLLISLALLVVLTLTVFGVSSQVLNQQKLTVNYKDDVFALQVAEAAMKDAERKMEFIEAREFTESGNNGFYDGECVTATQSCQYIEDVLLEDLFELEAWGSGNSREANTEICINNTICKKGRYKAILLGDATGDSSSLVIITSQNQVAGGQGQGNHFKLFKIVATGTDTNDENRKVLISYYIAPIS